MYVYFLYYFKIYRNEKLLLEAYFYLVINTNIGGEYDAIDMLIGKIITFYFGIFMATWSPFFEIVKIEGESWRVKNLFYHFFDKVNSPILR